MDDERLPPKNLYFSLPALTRAEAETLLHFVDTVQGLLWEAYGQDVFDYVDDGAPGEPDDPEDDIPF
jgi:hypothetical protein